jgi:hypothetical protein
MKTKQQIIKQIEQRIPSELWEKYSYLTFEEMANIDELAPWARQLHKAEQEMFDAES